MDNNLKYGVYERCKRKFTLDKPKPQTTKEKYMYHVTIINIRDTYEHYDFTTDNKVEAIKIIRKLTNCSLVDVKPLITSPGAPLMIFNYKVTLITSITMKVYGEPQVGRTEATWPATNEQASDYWAHRDARQRGVY